MAALEERLAEVLRENAQLRDGLTRRGVVEQAKGVLAERHALAPDQALEAMAAAAALTSRRVEHVAAEVVTMDRTPSLVAVELEMARSS
jgi:AmiR/NasT family two-component response regulator